ncbi:hypothetical protein JQ629_13840 [Bradyrhizobium sp. AUGA SZCCT0222]|uniref:hypothetical protein n=1 Tax=Bradyrhizobium sp. AUGA SZCCT0222 TaxID=2807668 RepID=UPI001BAB0981|nr:hypothetical protein [Bradyrhizobium sp. AUGA SZCCT0222]MBR1268597.1 hypothetical protein [Bradyrhizobium sp. AUGA SZCCT0222]
MIRSDREAPARKARPFARTGGSDAAKALAIGLLLAPLGGLAGALMLVVPMYLIDGIDFPFPDFLRFLALAGISFGALLAAPTTLIALPVAAYSSAGWQGRRVPGLTAVGFTAGALSMMLLVLLTLKPHETVYAARALGAMGVGGAAGALCGAVLGLAMRQPD